MTEQAAFDINNLPAEHQTVWIQSFGNDRDTGYNKYHEATVLSITIVSSGQLEPNVTVTARLTGFNLKSFTGYFNCDAMGIPRRRPNKTGLIVVPLSLVFPSEAEGRLAELREWMDECLLTMDGSLELILMNRAHRARDAGADPERVEIILKAVAQCHERRARQLTLDEIGAEIDPAELTEAQQDLLARAKAGYPYSAVLKVGSDGWAKLRMLGYIWDIDPECAAVLKVCRDECPECVKASESGQEPAVCPHCGHGEAWAG